MADSESGYKVGPGRPPLHTRFKKGQSGNPGGRSTKSLPATPHRRPNPAGWPRPTRRWCSCSSRGCADRSCKRSQKQRRNRRRESNTS